MIERRPRSHRGLRSLLGAVLAGALLFVALPAALPAHADTQPIPGSNQPATVSSDALPTWQLTGVVWSQVLVGNTVYATGNFTKARPPGMWAGGPTEIDVAHLFAYDIRTGERIASFNHTLNAAGLAITASPDGSRIYVGGDFTAVDGQVRQHVAAFDTATGNLVPNWAPIVNGQVKAVTATASTVYVGGAFESAQGVARKRLAALSTSTGSLQPWAPTADDGYVWSLVVTPDGSKVVAGGQFLTMNGVTANGMGAVDAVTGASVPWAASSVIINYGKGATYSLTSDGTYLYGTGFAFGTGGKFEGTFSLNPSDGSIRWLVDCLGDTYDVEPIGDVVYNVSHAHECTMIGQFPDTSPRVRWQRANAYTTAATGVNNGPDKYGWNYKNQPAPSMLHWYPDLAAGPYSGQGQAAWSVVGNSDYVALGGEFPKVNGKAQLGLTRFAVKDKSTNKVGPQYDILPARPVPATTATAIGGGTVRVNFGSAWDKDNQRLTYQVYRDKGTPNEALIKTITADTNFWTVPNLTVNDTSVPAGAHTYQVRIVDPFNNELLSPVSNSVSVTDTLSAYGTQVLMDGADHYWRLGEASGTVAYDSAGSADGAVQAGVTLGAAGAINGDVDKAATFGGTSTGYVGAGSAAVQAPDTFTAEAWFKTTTTRGGKIIGYGSAKTGSSSSYDRHVYLDNSGKINFGVYSGGAKLITSPTAYNDGNWHQVVTSLSGAGTSLYVDGRLIGRDVAVTSGQSYKGYWRVGGDTLSSSWPNTPTSGYLAGVIDDVATYPTILTAAQVNSHYVKSGRSSTVVTHPPSGTYGTDVFNGQPQLYWRVNEAAGPVAADSSVQDNRGVFAGTPSYRVPGALTTSSDQGVGVGTANAALSSASNFPALGTYSTEMWFKTGSTTGGKLIGFGDKPTGLSANVDRNVTMTNAGKVRFATANPGGTQVAVDSPTSYNDNKWHYLVATQSPEGMRLYVDGGLVASDPSSASTTFNGYWRVGYDKIWSGSTSSYLGGQVDEVAVYSRALPLTEIKNRYRLGGGTVANQNPTANITVGGSGLKQTFSGTGSTDVDGTITGYSWNFGDGSPAVTTAGAEHTYAGAGTYQVSLTVTDNNGGTGTSTQSVTVTNTPPTAAFATAKSFLTVSVNGGDSADSDGAISSFAWNFGDGSTGTGKTAQHTYTEPGTYQVELSVTDNAGGTATLTQPVTVAAQQAPVAAFSSEATGVKVAFDGSDSSDPDGTIQSYAWDFGDGTAPGTGAEPDHTYGEPGSYQVELTVTDDQGATSALTKTVVVSNAKPAADFTVDKETLEITVDADTSSDPDGTIEGYAWKFGDGSTGSGKTATHAFEASGTYAVELTVTDNLGGTDIKTVQVSVLAANQKPVADFSSSSNELEASFDGTGSSDPDGTIEDYEWEFGDGSTDSGSQPEHDYTAIGTYTVKLTVTDDRGATDSVSKQITITGPLAKDDFNRTQATGWGSAEVGGNWTLTGSSSLFGVNNGWGTIKMASAGSGPSAKLAGVSSNDTDVQLDFSFDKAPTGGGQFLRSIVRGDQSNGYVAKAWMSSNGNMTLYITKVINGADTDLAVKTISGLTFQAGQSYSVRVQAWGTTPTNLRAKLWKSTDSEPTAWAVSQTDSHADLQNAGGIAVRAYLSGSATSAPVVASVRNLLARPTGN